MTDRERPRRIVRLAAECKDDYTREWLLRDERGNWEKEAIRLLEIAAHSENAVTLPEGEIDVQCAIYIRLQALTAQINHREKRGSHE